MLQQAKRLSLSKASILLTMLVMTLVSANLNWAKDHWKGILESDAKGYYAYLPAIFIYHDLNFGFFDEIEKKKYYHKNLFYDYRTGSDESVINKYFCGTALAQLPFFLIAHGISSVSAFESDGYSKPYPLLITVAALFYLLIGLIFIDLTLKLYGIEDRWRAMVPVAAVFGTNLFYYTVGEPGMSHIYSFASISMFIYFSKIYFSSCKGRHLITLAALLAIIVLVRPINGIVLFSLPFLAGGFSSLMSGIKALVKMPKWSIISILTFISIISIQPIIYSISTGGFMAYSYGEERVDLFQPHMMEILFSYKKGLFLYTPMYLLSLTGFYFLWKERKFEFYSLLVFFFTITYILSSWWMWFYGGSFSSRVYVEYLPMFMVLLGLTLNNIQLRPLRSIYISLTLIFVVLCQIQTYQYRYYQIHWSDMTKEKYWDVFLRIDKLAK